MHAHAIGENILWLSRDKTVCLVHMHWYYWGKVTSPVGPLVGVDDRTGWGVPRDGAPMVAAAVGGGGGTMAARLIAAATWSWTIRRTSDSSTGAGREGPATDGGPDMIAVVIGAALPPSMVPGVGTDEVVALVVIGGVMVELVGIDVESIW